MGDHISGLNLYRAYIGVPKSQQLAWCQERFVSARSLHKATDIYQQLHPQLVDLKLPIASAGTEVELVLRALVAGLFTNVARRQLNGMASFSASQALAVDCLPLLQSWYANNSSTPCLCVVQIESPNGKALMHVMCCLDNHSRQFDIKICRHVILDLLLLSMLAGVPNLKSSGNLLQPCSPTLLTEAHTFQNMLCKMSELL